MLRIVSWIVGVGLLGAIIAGLAGFFSERAERGGDLAAMVAVDVSNREVATVIEREVPSAEQYPATIRPARQAVVSARILAEVRDVFVTAGSSVEEGALIAKLDDRDLIARHEQAREALTAAEARLAEARPAFERIASLRERNVAPQSDFDSAQAAMRAASAEVDRARRSVEEAEVSLSFATVVAPFNGVVVDRLLDPGDLASPATPLVEMYDPTRMRAEAFVREGRARQLEVGETIRIALDDVGAGAALVEGTVEEIVPQADAAARSVLVKVALPSSDAIYPGLFARLELSGAPTRRVFAPANAVRSVGQLRYVELAEPAGGRRMITIGSDSLPGGWLEIASGLDAGDRVLLP